MLIENEPQAHTSLEDLAEAMAIEFEKFLDRDLQEKNLNTH
jgi:hypothetical protein